MSFSIAALACIPFLAPQSISDVDRAASVDWRAIRAAYDAGRHAATADEAGFQAHNPGQAWRTRFDGRGFTVVPDHGSWTWGLELASYGFVGAMRRVPGDAATCADGSRVESARDATLTEWYENDARGLEHGFTVHARPDGSDGELQFELCVRGELTPRVLDGGRDVEFVDEGGDTALTYSGLVAFDATGRRLPARFERTACGLALLVDEHGARYPITIDPIAQQQAYLKASNTGAGDQFGASVAIDGDTVVVSAVFEDSNSTGVNGDQSNNLAAGSGAAYVFVRSGTTWSQQAYLKASNTNTSDRFGDCVAIDGDTIVVTAMPEDSAATGVSGDESDNSAKSAGAAYVFVRSGTSWSQQAYLKASNTEAGDVFGKYAAIDGDTIVVTASDEDSNSPGVNGNQADNSASAAGAAYVFVRNGTTWTQQAYLKAPSPGNLDRFGVAAAIDGDTIVIGSSEEDSNATGVNGDPFNNDSADAGAAYVFVRSGTTWSQQAYLKASNTGLSDRFGGSVSISGDTVAVGAWQERSNATGVDGNQLDNSAQSAGAVYVFTRSGSTWSQQAYVKASNTGANDLFGGHVAVSGDLLVVGATSEDSNATGVNGNQSDESASSAGAVYVFWRSGGIWSQYAYLKASNSSASDVFSFALDASGNDIVVGAFGEDSSATGVNGNESDNSAESAGAAYVFAFEPPYAYYCSGDGTLATPCPCVAPNTVPSPPAAPGHGCANSLDLNGALLAASGTLSPDTLTIAVQVAPVYSGFAFLVKGNASNASGIAASDGVRCVDGALIRFGSHNAGTNGNPTGQWIYPNTAQTIPISAATLQPAGQTAYYQLFYRNAAAAFCTTATANWSSGAVVHWP